MIKCLISICFLGLFLSCGHRDMAMPALDGASRQWIDSTGSVHTVIGEVTRIVSLAPSISEWICALGKESLLVGRTDYCRWPASLERVPSVGGMATPSLEHIIQLKPDIVLVSGLTPIPVVEQIRHAGLVTAELHFSSLNEILQSAQLLKEWVGTHAQGERLLQSWQTRYRQSDVPAPVASQSRPEVVVLFGTAGLFSAGRHTFVETLITRSGGINLPSQLDSSEWPEIAEEMLIAWDPDLIVVHFDEDVPLDSARRIFMERWGARPMWRNLRAIRNANIQFIVDSRLSIPGPRLLEVQEMLDEWIGDLQHLPGEDKLPNE